MRIPFIAGNWKMFKTKAEAIAFAEEFRELTRILTCRQLSVLRSQTRSSGKKPLQERKSKLVRRMATSQMKVLFEKSLFPCWKRSAWISCIRHSERRQYLETDETVNKKLKKLFEGPIRPILCVGESLEERDADKAFDVVGGQIKADLEGIDAADVKKLVIAYEPIWAIGTGRTATPDQAEEMCAFIRKTLIELYGEEVSDEVIIQYGGSVKPANATEIMNMDEIDGALVGGASLKPKDFMEIIDF